MYYTTERKINQWVTKGGSVHQSAKYCLPVAEAFELHLLFYFSSANPLCQQVGTSFVVEETRVHLAIRKLLCEVVSSLGKSLCEPVNSVCS